MAPSYPAQGQEVVAADIVHPRVVLACVGESGTVPLRLVAAGTGVSGESVRKWRVRFMERRLDGLADACGPGRCGRSPTSGSRCWSRGPSRRRAAAGHALVDPVDGRRDGPVPVRSLLDLARLRRQAHLAGTGKLGTGPGFIARVRGVAGRDIAPPGHALVLAAGEKSQIRALDRTAPCLPVLPAAPGRPPAFAQLASRRSRRSARRSDTELEAGIRARINERNNNPRSFAWAKSASEILGTRAGYCQRITAPGR